MSTVTHTFHRPIAEVFAVLAEPRTYPEWLVGAKAVRSVDDAWPAPGSSFRHRVGLFGPLTLADSSTSLALDAPHALVLEVRARPVGRAKVTFHLDTPEALDDGGGVLRGADRPGPPPGPRRRAVGGRAQRPIAPAPRRLPARAPRVTGRITAAP